MAGPEALLAKSLQALHDKHAQGQFVFQAEDLSPTDRRRLLAARYLEPIIKGWYLTRSPQDRSGDTTPWSVYWREFVSRYAQQRFDADWHLSPEMSLAEHTSIPFPAKQIAIQSTRASNNVTGLIHGWSLFDYQLRRPAPASEIVKLNGLNVLSLPYSLTQVSETFFHSHKKTAELAVGLLQDSGDLARLLLELGKPVVAGRLLGALRAAGRGEDADEMRRTIEAGGVYRIEESNPFVSTPTTVAVDYRRSPYLARIASMWADMRLSIIEKFDEPPGVPEDVEAYLADVEERYITDAYHSLSIEGYRVTPELIQRVRAGTWNPDSEEDRASRDALAARGYWLAHNAVKNSIRKILAGANPGSVLRVDHRSWYRELWTPSVQAGLLKAADLAGYRNHPIYIRFATHVPPPQEAVRDCMPQLFDLLENEEHPAARAVLGHLVFVFIHPYADGNGRLARFLMNAMLASGGYCWTVIEVDKRVEYFAALDEASAKGNIKPFAAFIAREVHGQTIEKPKRKTRHR